MFESPQQFVNASLSALGINGLTLAVGENELWWVNLIGTVIAMIVAAIVGKKRKQD